MRPVLSRWCPLWCQAILIPWLPWLMIACSAGPPATDEPVRQETACWSLASVQGPEDLVVDHSVRPPRLLVSSRDVDGERSEEDGIYAVTLDRSGRGRDAVRLELGGRDDCSFHPHGISLVRAGGASDGEGAEATETASPWLLYVINHHEPGDASPAAGCFPGIPERDTTGERVTSVEVYRVGRTRLTFLQRLAAPQILTHANDLVALPDGQVWITNPPPGAFAQLREMLFGNAGSQVVHFACTERRHLRCRGHWRVAWTGGRFVNGIAHAPGRDGSRPRLYVASSIDGRVHTFSVTAPGQLEEEDPVELGGVPDNLTWLDERREVLLVAVHASLRRFIQHSLHHRARSPWRVERLRLDGVRLHRPILRNDGMQASGASTAVCVDGDLILGQVFGEEVLRCAVSPPCDGSERGAP